MDLTQYILMVDHANTHRMMHNDAEGIAVGGFLSCTAGGEIMGNIACMSDSIAPAQDEMKLYCAV